MPTRLLRWSAREIDGLCSGYSPLLTTHASLLSEKRVRLILHSGRLRNLKAIRTSRRSSTSPKTTERGACFVSCSRATNSAAPISHRPASRRIDWRRCETAFKAALADPALQAEASKLQLDMTLSPAGGARGVRAGSHRNACRRDQGNSGNRAMRKPSLIKLALTILLDRRQRALPHPRR